MSRTAASLAFAAALLASGAGNASEAPHARMFGLITERLALMKPVAAWKYANGAAVEDLEREAVVLERAAADAAAGGLDADTTRRFFQAQITAAKEIQNCWIARWQAGDAVPPADPPDLKTEIRPELITIGSDLLAAIGNASKIGIRFGPEAANIFTAQVQLDCLYAQARDNIYMGLGEIRPAE